MSTVVIPCGRRKQSVPAPAADLYVGTAFTHARRAAERDGRPWLILSSRFGLVTPDTVLPPYEAVTKTKADSARLAVVLRTQPWIGAEVESWCPAAYTEAMVQAGMVVVADPLRGLRLGERVHWLKEHAA